MRVKEIRKIGLEIAWIKSYYEFIIIVLFDPITYGILIDYNIYNK